MGSEWKTTKLLEHYEIRSGLSKPAKDFGSGYPFLTFKDVFYNYFTPDKLGDLVQSNDKERENCSVKRGDVFLTRTSETMHELGMSSVALKDYENATFNGFCKRLRPTQQSELLPEYVGYYLRSSIFRQAMLAFSTMSTRASLNNEMIGRLEISYPPKMEQVKIATILKNIDDKITLNRQINQTLEQMAQTLFKSWFVDFDPVVDNALDAGFFEQDLAFSDELLRRVEVRKAVRESDNFKPLAEDIRQLFPNAFEERAEPALGLGGWVPKGWKGQPIKTHCVKIQNGGTPSRSNSDYWDGGNIPWLTSGEVRQSIVTNVENTITDLGLQNSSAKWVSSYSTLVALYGATAGEVSINVDPLTTNQAVCALIPKESYCWFNYLQVRNKTIEMQNQAVGSAQQNISKRLVENLIVISPLPYIVEIFNQRVEPLFLKSIFNQKMAMELTKLRDTLLPKLISGELSLSDIKIDITEEILI
ncbi:restriction endonuclease subunit S [Proteus mirabilis]|uniref:restriction endonuclease subunit S n=1 Tax=Proteus mirabilis TaxID=584 RepID=UPI0016271487|nr:restriction endonuclease subunit S [Proteus mirabilis]MBB6686614.1 restriction endonuclease subunit S [Proteus mirabilis]HEJ9638226.1 restriction endonuclease subunit S [Proteus mirabilis]HEK0447709.1 restriction endonuclease subunit S [Proteus mirabilis]